MSTQNPAPYPPGQRVLTLREQLQRAQALAHGYLTGSCLREYSLLLQGPSR